MGLKQDIVIKSKFKTKSAGNYILRYTSREGATESLEIEDYITKYTPRYNATEELKQEAELADEVWLKDEALTRKQGVMFGNRGLSYSDNTVKEAARVTQKASEEGHMTMIPLISFSHQYLVDKGIVEEDMEEPVEDGEYKGKIDQLKLRQAITDMMNKMHQDMGFNKPEWTATIHLDKQHVHAHLTTVETGEPKEKRMMWVDKEQPEKVPRMKWHVNDKTSLYETSLDNNGFMKYKRNNEIVAEQERTKKGNPKWMINNKKGPEKVLEERGKIHESTKAKMRNRLNRSLDQTKDIKPFVKDIREKEMLTKNLTISTIEYNNVTAKKMQALQIALPENKKMWRAGSNAKDMERAHEIANEIIDDIWTRHKNGVGLDDVETSINAYIDTRQYDEKFSDDYRETLYSTEMNKLRQQSINALYKTVKENVKEEDKNVEMPVQSIKAADSETLKSEIARNLNDKSNNSTNYNNMIQFEYRNREYGNRYKKARYEAYNFNNELNRYDELDKRNQTTNESKVVREYYQKELKYHTNIRDKYDYLSHGKQSNVSKQRFEEVKGTDLINMLYDYGKDTDRSIPRTVAKQYYEQTNGRKEALDKTLNYLIDTGQFEQYELMKEHRDSIRKEADISSQIQEELSMPIPKDKTGKSIESRKTIDTIQGRRLLKEQIRELQNVNKEFINEYEKEPSYKKKSYKQNEYDNLENNKVNKDTNMAQYHNKQEQEWFNSKAAFDNYLRMAEQRRRKEEILEAYYTSQNETYKSFDNVENVKFKTSKETEGIEK